MIISVLSGSAAGIASTIGCHPLDTIRTRLQTSAISPHKYGTYKGAVDCARRMVAQEGATSLYKGMAGPLAAQAVYKAVMFGAFRFSSHQLGIDKPRQPKPVSKVFLCGWFAGTVNSFFVCPIELVRNRLMVQRSAETTRYSGIVDCVRQTIRDEGGVKGLWRGQLSTMLRDGPGVGMWFACFQVTKRTLVQTLGFREDSILMLLLSGAMGGVGFWLIALPFDTIKSNIQTTRRMDVGIIGTASKLGLGGLYTGLGISLLRGIPGAGIVFLVQTKTQKLLERQL